MFVAFYDFHEGLLIPNSNIRPPPGVDALGPLAMITNFGGLHPYGHLPCHVLLFWWLLFSCYCLIIHLS
jgi:hypothetical protein